MARLNLLSYTARRQFFFLNHIVKLRVILTSSTVLIYLFGVLLRFQHCTCHITTGTWKGRGNQYIQLVKVLHCKLSTNSKRLPAFPLEAMPESKPQPQRWKVRVLPLCHHGPLIHCEAIQPSVIYYKSFISLFIRTRKCQPLKIVAIHFFSLFALFNLLGKGREGFPSPQIRIMLCSLGRMTMLYCSNAFTSAG